MLSDEEIKSRAKLCPYHRCLPTYMDDGWDYFNEHRFYCDKCKEKNPTPGKWNSFGYGFTSYLSKSAALNNWNKACLRRAVRIMKEAIAGNVDDEFDK